MKNKRKSRVLLKDVASRAGVSKTLVSAVLNGKAKQHRISDKTASLVLEIAKEMQYSTNMIARGLRTGRAELIGLIVTDISNPFYSTISRIVENKTSKLNYKVIFGSSDENLNKTEELINIMLDNGVDGLIIVPCEGSEKLIEKLHNDNVPVVLLDRYFPELDVSYSCLNNYNATKLATLHLIEQGYKNISMISYISDLSNIKDRVSGYKKTMIKNSLETYIHVKSVDIDNLTPEIEKALDYLINEKNTKAIIFITNALLIAGLRSLKKMNKVIPQDLAVVGFYGGNELFDLFYSPITYIKQPLEDITGRAVKILIDKINHGENFKFSKLFIEPELIVQDSSIRPN